MPASTEALLIRPFAEPDRAALARIYARAFPDKLAAMLDGHVAAGPAIMTALVEPADTWVAVRDGAPVGVVCVKDEERPAPGHPLWRVLRRHLPPPAAARAWLHSWLIHTVSVGPDCLYLDYVAVEPAAQGEGVGGALLELVIDEARRRGKTSVGLYVIDRNRAARRLYERHGFVALRSEHLRLFRRVAGFR
ncbi:MAG TPA: GNAT family N-acetyltransferase, partial [Thermoleophilia bacterium]|nr:GNAT family N-acetyltransferase [Thermoleophilia bacterium]